MSMNKLILPSLCYFIAILQALNLKDVTIQDIQQIIKRGEMTCTQIIGHFLQLQPDQSKVQFNVLIYKAKTQIHRLARLRARELDKPGTPRGRLHCVPFATKVSCFEDI